MKKRRLERVAVMILSVAMLISSTGIMSSLAANVSESSSAPETSSSETVTSTTVAQEGGVIAKENVVEEGGSLAVDDKGNGTVENPYQISDVNDLLNMSATINMTSSANKNFVLTADIDLSSVDAESLAKRGGSLIGINKSLSNSSANVFFNFDGKGHKLKGLNINDKTGSLISIFGFVNERSTIKNLVVDKPHIVSTSESMISASTLVFENKGTITGVEILYPVITLSKSSSAAFVASVNEGTISKVTIKASHTNASAATAENHTISAFGSVGAVAGVNRGTIISVSAINIGMFVPASETVNTVYGGIAGRSSGRISDSVSTGNVFGGKAADIAGGIVGKAETGLKLTNDYTLVTLSKTLSGCAVIGSAGTADMLSDCYWSSDVSRRSIPAADCSGNETDLSTSSFRVLQAGKNLKLTKTDAANTVWGKAVFELDGAFSTKNDNITANENGSEMNVKSGKADSVNTVSYTAKISLPATVGSGAAVKQYMRIYVLNVPENTAGNGTDASPLEISNGAEFGFLAYASNLHVKLTKNISVNGTNGILKGSIDGCGYTVSTMAPLFGTVKGTVKNLNVAVNGDITTAVFGNVIGAQMSNVGVTVKAGAKLNANTSNTGIFANRVIGTSVLDDCRVKGNIAVGKENLSNIGGFAGVVEGKASKFTNSGAVVNISADGGNKVRTISNFIGSVNAENAAFENCYTGGANKAGSYMFIGSVNAKAISVKNIYVDYSADKNAASSAVNYAAYSQIIDKEQFREWKFDLGNAGFFTGNGSKFETTLPAIKAVQNSAAADFKLSFDAAKINAGVAVSGGKAILTVNRVKGVATVKSVPVTVTNTKTGLSTVIYVSNGLEKDSNGSWVVASAYDLAYVSENISSMNKDSFVVSGNIDMSGIDGFTSIGSTAVAFSGTFDGNGHTISNLKLNGTAKTAFFGTLTDATVKNVKFVNASVNSESGYAAVVAGQATGKTVISNVTVENATVAASGSFSAIIVGAVDNALGVKISDITVKNSSIKSNASYAGSVTGHATENTAIVNVTVDGFKAAGANYISGVVGLAEGEKAVAINNVKVAGANISGVTEISGIASGNGGVTIKNAVVQNSEISTAVIGSSFVAGGISSVFGSEIENVTVENTKLNAGTVGGIVGRTANDSSLSIKNAEVKASQIISANANTVAAGILAVHNVNGSAVIDASNVSADTVISGAAVTAGIVGDCSGAESKLSVKNIKSFADVNGSESADAISAAGALGRIGASAINNIVISGVIVGGSVSGTGVLGGIIGLIKKGEAYNGEAPIVSGSIAFPQIELSNPQTQCGMIIGGIEAKNVLASDMLDKAVSDVIISTYYGSVSAYSAESGLAGGKVTDMDKPNGKPITSSVPMLSTYDETAVTISNLPSVDGFAFDTDTGWVSESDERIQVVSSTENSAVLKANHMADISVVGYYVFDIDSQVRVPVHFAEASNIRTPLKGSGTKASPYLVASAYDLETVAQYISDGAYFALAEDIALTPEDFEFGGAFYNVGNGFVTLGSAESGFKGTFTGLYNGKVHSITGLSIAGNAFGGLFGAADGAVITDLVINDADVSGLNYAAVVVGSAKNTTIKNITINSAKVQAVEFGGYAGTVVGYAENTVIENVKVDGAEVKTNSEATSATIEIAGGAAGVFDGTVKDVTLKNVAVDTKAIGGGIVGAVRDEDLKLINVDSDADVRADIAGGAVGRAVNPLKLSISECAVSGSVNGSKVSGGIIGQVTADTSDYSADKAKNPIVSNTVVTADIADSEISGILIGDVSEEIICDKYNKDTNVFSNVFYSSYQNDMGLFGNEKTASYQNADYTAIDLNDISYVSGDAVTDYIPFTSDTVVLSGESLKLNSADGSYKAFQTAGKEFRLETIKAESGSALSYDAAKSELKLDSSAENAKAVLVYNDGLELAVNVSRAAVPEGEEPEETEGTFKVSFGVSDKTDGALGDKLIGISVKSSAGDRTYSYDTFMKANAKAEAMESGFAPENGIYVSAELPQGIGYSVKAVDGDGNELIVNDDGNEGYHVITENAESVSITITAERENITWGLRSVWSVMGK